MTVQDICTSMPVWAQPAIVVAVFIWEFILGETKFGSTIRLFQQSFVTLWQAITKGVQK